MHQHPHLGSIQTGPFAPWQCAVFLFHRLHQRWQNL